MHVRARSREARALEFGGEGGSGGGAEGMTRDERVYRLCRETEIACQVAGLLGLLRAKEHGEVERVLEARPSARACCG